MDPDEKFQAPVRVIPALVASSTDLRGLLAAEGLPRRPATAARREVRRRRGHDPLSQ